MKRILVILLISISTFSFASDNISVTCRTVLKEEKSASSLKAQLKVFNNGCGILFIRQKINIKDDENRKESAAIVFSTKEWSSISGALDKCATWKTVAEKKELEINKNIYKYSMRFRDSGEKEIIRIDFVSRRAFDGSLKCISFVRISHDSPLQGKSSFIMSVEKAQELSSMFKSVPKLEEQLVKAADLLK